MGLTPGETYIFTVYTVAADGVTESDPVSIVTCTVPGQAAAITVSSYQSVNSLVASWAAPAGKVDYYNISITGDVNNTIQTNTTSVRFSGLSPGREYTVTVQTVSGSCSNTASPVTEATYPSPSGNITFDTVGSDRISLSWGDPGNMNGVIRTYGVAFGSLSAINNASVQTMLDSVSSYFSWTTLNNTSVTLQNLTSGTNYTIVVVTVGVRGYWSMPVSRNVFTKPRTVNYLQATNLTVNSAYLYWSRPEEYQSAYRYRVLTNVTSSSTLINDTTVTSESATVMGLTPGETYTFTVYTVAADGVTESDPVSIVTCTVPGQAAAITVNSYQSVNSLVASWAAPAGKVDYYIVVVTGDVNSTIQTSDTGVNITGLSPGREYAITVQTVSGNCSNNASPVKDATYPSPPGNITFDTVGSDSISLSWGDPGNMNGVIRTYGVAFGSLSAIINASVQTMLDSNSSYFSWITSYNTSVTLQNLTSGTNYTIVVVTLGVRGYWSIPVSRNVFTKRRTVKNLRVSNRTSSSAYLYWSRPDEYQSAYSYRVLTNITSSSTLINDTTVTSESAAVMGLTPGETYTFTVYTVAADGVTESDPVSIVTCTVPGQAAAITVSSYQSVNSLVASWAAPAGKVEYYNISITGDVNNTIQTNTTSVRFSGLSPGREYTVTVQTVSGSCSSTVTMVTEATCGSVADPTPTGDQPSLVGFEFGKFDTGYLHGTCAESYNPKICVLMRPFEEVTNLVSRSEDAISDYIPYASHMREQEEEEELLETSRPESDLSSTPAAAQMRGEEKKQSSGEEESNEEGGSFEEDVEEQPQQVSQGAAV
ncbi:receptor-type tyrosine-protein phosphatase eta-like [Hyperolius riggenbachi]|uniref:receptor-type tyrosine-protein phosphatase eta-like n=1 Tax=Hyperolius riggenbachi TaxID=752182 RepID=UPI0035A378AE